MPRVPVAAARSLSGVAERSEAGHQGRPGWAALDWAILIKLLKKTLFFIFCGFFRFPDQGGQAIHLAFGIVGVGFCKVLRRAEISP